MEYIRTKDGETHNKADCVALYHIPTGPDSEPVLWAWQSPDDEFHDSNYVTDVTVYVIHGVEYQEDDTDAAEKYLTESFWGMFDESQRAELESDRIAMRESFANWTDALCKDGDICQDSYNDLDMAE
jgi:hypothetical protein